MYLAGVTHHGKRDLWEVFGYKRVLSHNDFVARYYRQGTAKRIIDAPVLATWGDPPTLQAQDEFETAWEEICQERTLFHHIIRLDKLAGLGRFAIMVVGFDDGSTLDTPITQKPGRKVIYLQPYAEGAVTITKYEEDNTSERFGKPVMYRVNPGRFQVDGTNISYATGTAGAIELRAPFLVHQSRVIHVAENLTEDGIFGTSRLEAIINDLDDLLKVSGAGAEIFWMAANRGMQVDVDKDMDLDEESMAQLQKEVEEYQHELRRFIRTRGVEINKLGSDNTDPSKAHQVIIQNISACTGIPQLVLQGASSGHLSSQQDRASWAERIAERVTEYAAPIVLKRTLDCFIEAGALPEPQDLEIHWPEAFKMNPLERAQTSAQMARSAANLAKSHMMMQPSETVTNADGTTTEVQQPTEPLFTPQEMRRMVSFGKHPPIFDNPQPTGGLTPLPGDPLGGQATPSGGGGGTGPSTGR